MLASARWGDWRLPPEFWLRVVPVMDCWLWAHATNDQGYGQVRWNGRTQYVHRIAYEHLVGPITKPHLDHLCRVTACCFPGHLEPVSVSENILRGHAGRCKRGHSLDDPRHGYVRTNGKRYCKTCNRMSPSERAALENKE